MHQTVWEELKIEATQITNGLRKRPPAQKEVTLEKPHSGPLKWVKKVQFQEPAAQEEGKDQHQGRPESQDTEESKWEAINERFHQLALDIPRLAAVVPEMGKILEEQGLKESYELNKTRIRDDQAPIIQVECKVRKHWKSIDKVTLDGGAGVNVMSKKVRKKCWI